MPTAALAPVPADPASAAAPSARRADIRMYRQGLGDCFLITLYNAETPFRILIDCGVILGTQNATGQMKDVAEDILDTCRVGPDRGEIDLLVGTHEHWDHLSGFIQATTVFDKIDFTQVWLGWTENPDDSVARRLVAKRAAAVQALAIGAARLRMSGSTNALGAADETASMLEFFGVGAGGGSTSAALEYVRGRVEKPVYRKPSDPPFSPFDGVRIYTLGPPTALDLLKKSTPSQSQSYGFDAVDRFVETYGATLTNTQGSPFGANRVIPLELAQHEPFFRDRYFQADEDRRRIDGAWLEPVSDLALKLDSDTNNTSLVLAIEFGTKGDVLLFAADAQIGNWLSWATLEWTVDGAKVTGPELLKRTILYKVGHHGSHNATLKPGGLELMEALEYAMIPVDQDMAKKKRWGRMPLDEIVTDLDRRTGGKTLRIDRPPPPAMAGAKLKTTALYFELTV